jgi:DNA-binding ferritin-like protein
MQDETVFPALEAMIPQFSADLIIFGQLKKWGHWHIDGIDFISLGPASDEQGLYWGQLEVEDEKIQFKIVQDEYQGG